MTDRSNLHLTGSAGWCQFRRIIAPFSSPSSAFLLYPSAFLRTYIVRHSSPMSFLMRRVHCLFSIFAYNIFANFSEITDFFQTCVFPGLDENEENHWKAFLLFEKNIVSYCHCYFSMCFNNRKKNTRIAERDLQYPEPSTEGPGISCQCHPTCAFLIRVALPVRT